MRLLVIEDEPKLADYLQTAQPGKKFIVVGQKSYAVESAAAKSAWDTSDDDIYVRLYDAGGNPRTGSLVAAGSSGFQDEPAIAMAPDGRFVVAWNDIATHTIRYMRFAANGTPRDPISVQANTYNTGTRGSRPWYESLIPAYCGSSWAARLCAEPARILR